MDFVRDRPIQFIGGSLVVICLFWFPPLYWLLDSFMWAVALYFIITRREILVILFQRFAVWPNWKEGWALILELSEDINHILIAGPRRSKAVSTH